MTPGAAARREDAAPATAGDRGRDARPSIRENVYGHRKRLEFIAARLREHQAAVAAERPLRVLDIGCGTGVMITRPLALRGHDMTGLDLDPVSIRQAGRLNVAPALPNLTYVVGRLEEQGWDGRFDAVVASEVLEHLPDPDTLVAALRRCLKPEGILLMTVPNGYGPFEIDSHLWEAAHRIPGFWRLESGWIKMKAALLALGGHAAAAKAAAEEEDRPESMATLNENSPHCQRFTRGRVVRLMERHGLRVVAWGKSAVWSGPFAHTLLRDFGAAIRLNCSLADRLPAWMTSGLYFCFARVPTAEDAPPGAQ
ncbi:MAG TPA: class I SAM-dependent methyltransferase [Patescibacteria group bacterium]|nr:class I SAM-dependent methyltransferase [Patescibacteria group bacterium]